MRYRHELKSLADLVPGDHLCCIYETEEEHRALVTPFLRRGLERNEKVFYIVDAHTSQEILAYLRDDGLEVDACLESGRLSVLTQNDSYMKEGAFDPDGMIEMLRSETELALEQGYDCLRVTGEMSWALRGLPGSDRLMEYEAKLNAFFPGSRALAICQYDRRRFSPEVLLDVLSTHPFAVVGTRVYDNFYYVPPEEFLGRERAASELGRRLRNLQERQELEEALRKGEEKFAKSFQAAPCMTSLTTQEEGRILDVNRAFLEKLGYAREEVVGRTMRELEIYEDYAERALMIEKLAEEGSLSDYEISVRGKGGRRLRGYVSVEPIALDGSDCMIVTFIDNTGRIRAEEALRESEARFRGLVEHSPFGIVLVDPDGRVREWNAAQEEITGLPAEEALGSFLWDMQLRVAPEEARTPEVLSGVREMIAAALESGEAAWFNRPLEQEILRPDGRRRVYRTVAFPVSAGRRFMVASIGEDVTEHRAAQEALRESEEKFRSLVEQSREGFVMTSGEGRIVEWNRAQEEISGIRRGEVLGEYIWDVVLRMIPGDLRTPEFCGFIKDRMCREYSEGVEGPWFTGELERVIEAPDGVRRTVQTWNYPIETGGGYMVGSISHDVTGRVEREKEMRRINADLRAFAHTLSHDLKGPLAVAAGYAATLERLLAGRLGATEADTLRETIRALESMNLIIDGMLQYASLDRPVETAAEVDLNALVRGVLEEPPEGGPDAGGVRFEVGALPVVAGDAPRLRQVLANLVSNAVKFSTGREGALVEVGTEDTPYGPAVFVRDNGPGIRPEDLERIFEPLARTEGASGLPGHGLGLAIVRRAVESWGGRAWAESEPGRGAAFYFTLPALPGEQAS